MATDKKYVDGLVCPLQTLLNAELLNDTSFTLKSVDPAEFVILLVLLNAVNAEVRISDGRLEILAVDSYSLLSVSYNSIRA